MTSKIYIISGEASGDFLGARLVAALKAKAFDITVRGVGGPLMTKEGMDILFSSDAIAVMGLVELIPHIRHIQKRIAQTIDDICAFQPSVLVTIDAPGFCNRVIKGVRERLKIPIVHYVAPSVWAWRPKRAAALAKRVDHLMCLFPFEPPYFECHGLPTTFVGHPLVEMDWTPDATFQSTVGLRADKKKLCVLPGSRVGEIKRHLDIFAQTINRLTQTEEMEIIVPTFPHFEDIIKQALPRAHIFTDPHLKRRSMVACDLALAASGTVSLELAMADTPMVIAYRASPLTYMIVKRLVNVSCVCLVNLIMNNKVVPEALQRACNPEHLEKEMRALLADNGAEQRAIFKHIKPLLSPLLVTPGEKAAEVVLSYV